MIPHSMDVIQRAVKHLYPGQVHALTIDQPLFVIDKLIQWNWPDVHGEDKFVILLGGLHNEMAVLYTLRDFLDGSGNIATAGTADSFLKAWHAHQVTSGALSVLLHNAYDTAANRVNQWLLMIGTWNKPKYLHNTSTGISSCSWSSSSWCMWDLLESNFALYVATQTTLAPWLSPSITPIMLTGCQSTSMIC